MNVTQAINKTIQITIGSFYGEMFFNMHLSVYYANINQM